MNGENRISGILVLSGPLPAQSASVTVSLIDATLADAPARVLSTAVFAVSEPGSAPIPFDLALPPHRPPMRRWLFDARVTADPAGHLAVGDYVLGRAVQYPETGQAGLLTLILERVN